MADKGENLNIKWNYSYREDEEDIIEQYEEDVESELKKDYFDKLKKIAENQEDDFFNSILNEDSKKKDNPEETENIDYIQYYIDLPFNNLNVVLKNVSDDAKVQLKFLFIKRYLNQCKELRKFKLIGLELFNIHTKQRIMKIFSDIINYLRDNIERFSEYDDELSIDCSFDNVADMFYELLDLMWEIELGTIDDCPPYDFTMSGLWSDLLEEKHNEDEE